MVDKKAFRNYVSTLQDNCDRGNATEHTHRPALKTLLEAALPGIIATNEPARVKCGAPDYSITTGNASNPLTIGYVEAKDVGISLDDIDRDSRRASPATQNGRQLKRYREALPNLLLTNYIEIRWYTDGELRLNASLAESTAGKLITSDTSIEESSELLSAFFSRTSEAVNRPEDLAKRMALLTHMTRDVVQQSFGNDLASENVIDLYHASKQTLAPDLSVEDFADMFAQTLGRVNTSAMPPL